MTALDSPVVQAVAEALAIDDWTDGNPGKAWTWDALDRDVQVQQVWDHLPAARVAVAAMRQAAA